MLQVGNAGMTLTEQRAHFSAWCISAAPLLVATDLISAVDPETLAILSAPELIAVNQDPLGVQGVCVSPAAPAGGECWAKPLADGSVAAMLLNRGPAAAAISCSWAELGLPAGASAAVRDLWARKDLGPFTGAYSATVESHGAVVVRVNPHAA